MMLLAIVAALLASASGTRNAVELYVNPYSFNQTSYGSECNYSVLGNFLFSNWQEVFTSGSGIPPIGSSGGIFYVEVNTKAPGNLVVGIAADNLNFVGFIALGGATNDGLLGSAINGTIETVTIPLPPLARDVGSGTAPPANETVVRRLNPDLAAGLLRGGASLAGIAPATSSVYGSSAQPTDGSCLGAPCPTSVSRWEVRIVVRPTGTTGVWAWSQGFRQFYAEYPIDLRGRSLTLHTFNMRRDVPPTPPLLSGIDVRLKLESSFSRVASRIFTGSEMRTETSLFTLYSGPYTIPPPNPSVQCPAVSFVPLGPPPAPGYVPLVRWDLSRMGVSLSRTTSYSIDVNVFVQNQTGTDNTVLVSLYDGVNVVGVLRLSPTVQGPWGSFVTGVSPVPALGFPLGLLPVSPVVVTPNTPLPLYSSRRIDFRVLAAFQAGSTQAGPFRNASLFAWDPEHPLLLTTRRRGTAYPQAPSVQSSLQPFTFDFAAPLSIVLWQQTPAGTGVTGAAVVVDEAIVGCDGVEYNPDQRVPAWDSCGVCGGTNACLPCDPLNPALVRDACGVCGGTNTTCCVDYNGVEDSCWNLHLLVAAITDIRAHFVALRSALSMQCMIMDRGTQGAASCCSPSVWNTSSVPGIAARACANRDWGTSCLAPFLADVNGYRAALGA